MQTLRWIKIGCLATLAALGCFSAAAQDPLTVEGVQDGSAGYGAYNDRVTIRVPVISGYSYQVTLDGNPIPAGVPYLVDRIDYHELSIWRTNQATSAVTNRLVRFIVRSSVRAGSEDGLPEWVPYPTIDSAAAEFAGASLRLVVPANFPFGYPVPVVAWVEDAEGHAVRVNGVIKDGAPGMGDGFRIKRGVGSGFLAAPLTAGALLYHPQVGPLDATRSITIEDTTTWVTVSSTLNGDTTWSENSRIHITGNLTIPAGVTLSIGAGTIVRVGPSVDINNNGQILISGTTDNPVVFMPATTGQPWGGFIQHANNTQFTATGTIFTGAGANQGCWFTGHGCSSSLSGIGSHRAEQALISLRGANCNLSLTDCAAIYLAGQFGHSASGSGNSYAITMNRFLLQRCTTGGEYTGALFSVNDSAFIECTENLGAGESPEYIDGDNDGLYIVSAPAGQSHLFNHTLIGWTKDDGVDSGGGSAGRLTYTNCWFEGTFHEGNSLSGNGKDVRHYGSVFINCGQGIEDGYDAPTGRVERCLILANLTGVRFGDNYNWTYNGFQYATNSVIIHNYRDVWGMNWQPSGGWTYRTNQMDVQNNWLSALNPFHSVNQLWNPDLDTWRLASFRPNNPGAPVGLGLAVWTNQFAMTDVFEGVPVRLSSFTTNAVSVAYEWSNQEGYLAGGTLSFAPGETVKRIYMSPGVVTTQNSLQLTLSSPAGAELTGRTNVLFSGSLAVPQVSLAVSTATLPGYRLPEGVFVRLSSPAVRQVIVTYGFESHTGEALETGTNVFAPGETSKQIYLHKANPFNYESVRLALGNADGATFGATTSVTFTNPVLAVSFAGGASQLDLDSLTNGLAIGLNSPAGAGVSVPFTLEGAEGVLTNGVAAFAAGQTLVVVPVPSVNPLAYTLLRARLGNPTGAVLGSPSTVYYLPIPVGGQPTNTVLIANSAVWRYRDVASAAPATWNTLGFDDSAWPSGPAQLGFSGGEENDEATLIADNNQITSYFRHPLVVADPAAYTNLALALTRDDAGVVYVNGAEVYRSPNLPAGAISYSTTTLSPNGENTVDRANVSPASLVAGTNLVAVEIHQQNATSSDVSFALELIGHGAPPPAAEQHLRMTQFGAEGQQLTLGWADGRFVLQEAASVTGPWTNVVAPSPVTVPVNPAVPQRFYRIWKP